MSGFIDWLEKLNQQDTKVRAVLRRSLAFDPGQFVHAFPYVESFVGSGNNSWHREMHYLVAGLWATHWREGRINTPLLIGKACAIHQLGSDFKSTERHFISLLDADGDQLPHRLRQMVALLKDQDINFESLLRDVLYWNDEQKRTQKKWARDFYRTLNPNPSNQQSTETETTE